MGPAAKLDTLGKKILLAVPGFERQSLGDPPTSLNPLQPTLSLINRRRRQKGLEEGNDERKMLRFS